MNVQTNIKVIMGHCKALNAFKIMNVYKNLIYLKNKLRSKIWTWEPLSNKGFVGWLHPIGEENSIIAHLF